LPSTEAEPGPRTWETTNLLHLGQALCLAAGLREETRGGHVRSDFPERAEAWRGRLHLGRRSDGTLQARFAQVPRQAAVEAADAKTAHHESIQHESIQHESIQHESIQHESIQHESIQHESSQHETIRLDETQASEGQTRERR